MAAMITTKITSVTLKEKKNNRKITTVTTVITKMTTAVITTIITEMTITITTMIMIPQMIIGLFQTLFCVGFHPHRHRGKIAR